MNARHAVLAAMVMVAANPGISFAQKAESPEPQVFDVPAGLGCEFELRIAQTGGNLILKEFYDRDGNKLRILQAGKGFDLVLTNLDTGKRLTLPTPGSVMSTRLNADGTQTVSSTGHNLVVLFPTDVPAGPSTVLYIGRLVYLVNTSGAFIVQSFNGRTRDICAELRG